MKSLVLRLLLMALTPAVIAVVLLAIRPASAAFPGVNGKILFETNRDSNQEIYTMNADGSLPVNLTRNFAVDQRGAWSADGQKIAFHSTRAGNFEIHTMDANGVKRLTFASAIDFDPAWSPDGTKIVFDSSRDDASREIYVMNAADGSNVTRLTFQPGVVDGMAAWSPDGTKIAFRSNRDGNFEIYVMNADGTGQTNLTNHPAQNDTFPNWSPDGTKIAFNSDRDGNLEVYVMYADGTGQTNLSKFPGAIDGAPAWSPDGTKIAFQTFRDGNSEIYVMNADGTGQVNVTNHPAFDALPDWGTPGLTCVDLFAPQLNVSLSPNVLTPPDRTMRTIGATLSVNDDCDPNPNVVLLNIVPSGPDIPNPEAGPLSGLDIQEATLGTDDREFLLRAELDADGSERSYVVTYLATDASGKVRNVARVVTVSLPGPGGP
jgi:TolB protein